MAELEYQASNKPAREVLADLIEQRAKQKRTPQPVKPTITSAASLLSRRFSRVLRSRLEISLRRTSKTAFRSFGLRCKCSHLTATTESSRYGACIPYSPYENRSVWGFCSVHSSNDGGLSSLTISCFNARIISCRRISEGIPSKIVAYL